MERTTVIRTKHLDPDFRRNPRTSRYCVMCQRDLAAEKTVRGVWFSPEGMNAIHPDDVPAAPEPKLYGLLGSDCAKRLGHEWSNAILLEKDEATLVSALSREAH
jgi:hypothetical protein